MRRVFVECMVCVWVCMCMHHYVLHCACSLHLCVHISACKHTCTMYIHRMRVCMSYTAVFLSTYSGIMTHRQTLTHSDSQQHTDAFARIHTKEHAMGARTHLHKVEHTWHTSTPDCIILLSLILDTGCQCWILVLPYSYLGGHPYVHG